MRLEHTKSILYCTMITWAWSIASDPFRRSLFLSSNSIRHKSKLARALWAPSDKSCNDSLQKEVMVLKLTIHFCFSLKLLCATRITLIRTYNKVKYRPICMWIILILTDIHSCINICFVFWRRNMYYTICFVNKLVMPYQLNVIWIEQIGNHKMYISLLILST
mgnify:CR=1 FL=1